MIISNTDKEKILEELGTANKAFQRIYPGDRADRQPVHTVYGGADLFKYNTAEYLGKRALESLLFYAPDFSSFGRAFRMEGHEHLPVEKEKISALELKLMSITTEQRLAHPANLSHEIYHRVIHKLKTEAVEDFRIDFEDGFGNRSDEEEDSVAMSSARELAQGMEAKTLPPFIGIRIKPFTEELKKRGSRTLDIFLKTLLDETEGIVPKNFVVMLPKVTIPEQVSTLIKFFEIIETKYHLNPGTLKMEMMVETTQAIMSADGTNPLRQFILASKGRCIATHFGTYDYTASCNITAKYQEMDHPVCDFAHHMTKVALSHTGVWLSDGATNTMPIGPHRGQNLTEEQIKENIKTVHNAWRKGYMHIRHSLWNGYYQGWDLNPAQLPMRYTAVFFFFPGKLSECFDPVKNLRGESCKGFSHWRYF